MTNINGNLYLKADTEKVITQTHLHPMQIWLLGCTLPLVYTRPTPVNTISPSINGIVLMDPRTFITRMASLFQVFHAAYWKLINIYTVDGVH